MIGIGVGAAETLPAIDKMPEMNLMAGADVDEITRDRFVERFPNAKAYASVEELVRDPDVEAVWIATPNRFHAEHTILAAEHGKHIVVEKPMALDMKQAREMVSAAERNNVKLLAGHTRSYTTPIRVMRRIIESGKLGKLCAIQILSYSDWMLRPRSADELDIALGGGIPFRQGPHQIDTVRVLGGGQLRSVRATVGQWMPERPIPGYYAAHMEFENGVPATIVHNGYGYFLGAELVPWGGTKQHYSLEERVSIRKQMESGTRDENVDKQDSRIGGQAERDLLVERTSRRPWIPEDMGMLIVSCERGDIRHSEWGVYVYDDDGIHDLELPPVSSAVGRRAELEELYNAIVLGAPVYHSGTWGAATLEVCLALMESSKERREIMLQDQVPVPDGYDSELEIPYLNK